LHARLESDPFLARGFRPFFLLAALHVTVGIPMWALMNVGVLGVPVRFSAAFAIFLALYGPMLLAPRVDGRPG
jgi:uncharacterized protein involved in response to NO